MPLETYTGPRVGPLLTQASTELGPDAVVIRVKRVSLGGLPSFEVTAADPLTAAFAKEEPTSVRQGVQPSAATRRGQVVAIVGPTGSGKTTTLAKLANHPDAFADARVGFLCMDTYKIGAVEQLSTYADLSKRPIEVVYEPDDVPRALTRLSDVDVILVDTPGRGPGLRQDLAGVAAMLNQLPAGEVHLAIPAGIRPEFASVILAEHRAWGVTHLLATKTDEWTGDDAVFELAVRHGLPMRWLTDGQEVPTDLRMANSRYVKVARRLGTLAVSTAGWSA